MIQAGLDVSDEPAEARRAARLLHAYELRFWDALADAVEPYALGYAGLGVEIAGQLDCA